MQCVAITGRGVQCTHNGNEFENLCKVHHNQKYKKDSEYKARYDARPALSPILIHIPPAAQAAPAPAPAVAVAVAAVRAGVPSILREPAVRAAPAGAAAAPAAPAAAPAEPTFAKISVWANSLVRLWLRETVPGFDLLKAYIILTQRPIYISGDTSNMIELIKVAESIYRHLPNYTHILEEVERSFEKLRIALIPFGEIELRVPPDDPFNKWITKRIRLENNAVRERALAEQRRIESEAAIAEYAIIIAAERRLAEQRLAEQRHQLQIDLRERPVVFKRDPEGSIDLAAFATDTQNIHRSSVQNATEKAVIQLMTRTIANDQETLPEIITDLQNPKKLRVSVPAFREKIIAELTHDYFETVAFSVPYGNVLDRVWTFIRGHKDRPELFVRLAQEIAEGISMCTNGKMARLVNVLQGFDDTLTIEAPKEVFHEKMAQLMKLPPTDRISAANALFLEFSIPETEHAAWLEPLEAED